MQEQAGYADSGQIMSVEFDKKIIIWRLRFSAGGHRALKVGERSIGDARPRARHVARQGLEQPFRKVATRGAALRLARDEAAGERARRRRGRRRRGGGGAQARAVAARAVAAARNSWSGLVFAMREESAFRQELFLAVVLVPVALWMPATVVETTLMLASLVIVLIVELLNSSVEAAVDRISYSKHGLSKRAKDYGSAAVMLAIMLCGAVYALIAAKYYL